MTIDRPNTTLATAVDQALVVLEQRGARAAGVYLAEHGAGFALTCRVLAEPGRRRQSGLKPVRAAAPADS